MKLFNQAMIPTYRDINLLLPNGYKQIPEVSTYLRKGQRLLMFAVPNSTGTYYYDMDSITIKGTNPTGDPFEIAVPINRNLELKGDMIKKFSAFASIKELEMFKSTLSPEKIKEEIVSLGLENKIVTQHTSLIAIDLDGDNKIQRSMDLVIMNETFQDVEIGDKKNNWKGGGGRGRGGRGGVVGKKNFSKPMSSFGSAPLIEDKKKSLGRKKGKKKEKKRRK